MLGLIRLRPLRVLKFGAALAVLMVGARGVMSRGHAAVPQKHLNFTVEFADAQGLKAGDAVQLRGVDVGRVGAVRLLENPARVAVDVSIDPGQSDRVHSDAAARIARAPLSSNDHERVLKILETRRYLASASDPSAPVAQGQTVRGLNGDFDAQAWKMNAALTQGAEVAADQAHRALGKLQSLGDDVQSFTARPEVRDLVQRVRAFGDEIDARGRNAAGQMHSSWTQLLAQIDSTIGDLNAIAHSPEVGHFVELISQIGSKLDALMQDPAPPDPYRSGHYSSRPHSMF